MLCVHIVCYVFLEEKICWKKKAACPASQHTNTYVLSTHIRIHMCRDLVHLDSLGPSGVSNRLLCSIENNLCSVCMCVRIHTHTPTYTSTRVKAWTRHRQQYKPTTNICRFTRACASMQRCSNYVAMETIANYHESCANIVQALGCRTPTCCHGLGALSPTTARSKKQSKFTLAHDAVATALWSRLPLLAASEKSIAIDMLHKTPFKCV